MISRKNLLDIICTEAIAGDLYRDASTIVRYNRRGNCYSCKACDLQGEDGDNESNKEDE